MLGMTSLCFNLLYDKNITMKHWFHIRLIMTEVEAMLVKCTADMFAGLWWQIVLTGLLAQMPLLLLRPVVTSCVSCLPPELSACT